MSLRPMSPVDAAWYHIDGPVNLAQVTGVLFTRTPLDFERVKAVYARRLAPFARFHQRVVEAGFPVATPYWEDVPGFSVEQHIHHVALPAPRDAAALTELLSDLASTPLDRGRPLWQIHVIDEVDEGSALVMRFHHCIGDGTAMMALARETFDTSPDAPLGAAPSEDPEPSAPRADAPLLDRWLVPALDNFGRAARTVIASVGGAIDVVSRPQEALDRAAMLIDGAGVLLTELLKSPDPASPFKGPFGLGKRVAWSAPVALSDVKEIGARFDAKVNDVLVAGLTGALRTYLSARGAKDLTTSMRAMVPVDLRPAGRGLEMGNEFGLVILELPIAEADPLERVRETKTRMDVLKASPEAVAIMALFNLFGRGPKLVEDFAVDLFSSKASLVLTNVAGSQSPLYLAGTPIDRVMFWVPHPGKQLGMGVSILSYNGAATLSVITDAGLVPDPEEITRSFNREFDALLALARRRRPTRARRPRPASAPKA